MGRCHVIDDAEAVLFCDIGSLDTCFFAYFAAYGCKGIWICRTCIKVAFKEAADDVVTTDVDGYLASSLI
ncbi:MAG TPA: hypothetical protein DCL75_00595 [Ktedonobacter sp.]|nr:hypothetical protein [Ktedonobacter sp.]HAT46213.1 hypothetical protein [Ktedonobacter sp.]